MLKIISTTDLQQHPKKYLKLVRESGEPIVVTQRGRGAAVLMSLEAFEGLPATLDEMSYPDWQERIERAERDSKAGKGIELETFLRREAKRRRRAS